jgi:hypothetical protein
MSDHFIPKHIAVVDHANLDPSELAFHVAAVEIQLRDHVAPLWDGWPPGVAFYGHAARIPPDQAAVLAYVLDDGNAESAGYHTEIAGLVYGLVDVGQSRLPSVTLSHEACEMYGNARLSRTVPGPKNRLYYVELCDPTQAQTYEIEVTLFGVTRKVPVSDFVLPGWYGIPNTHFGDVRTTYMGQQLAPFQVAPGGYQIAEDTDGEIIFLSGGESRMNRSAHSRTDRIRRGKVGPAESAGPR